MNFFFLPTLQSMAATQIVTRLWNRADVSALIAECDEIDRGERWKEIEENVNGKVSLLRQPAPLREKLSSVVVPIGDEIRRWKATHVQTYQFKYIPPEFCWTSLGTVEKKKTAEIFVRDVTLPESERYWMACLYCLEWDSPVPFHGTEPYPINKFVAYWAYETKGDETALYKVFRRNTSKSHYQWAFDYAVSWWNEVAVEYYFRKLTPREREESLSGVINFIMSEIFSDFGFSESLCDVEGPRYLLDFGLFRFLLPRMNERQQSKLYEIYAPDVLECLLEWPWQPLFMDVARRVWDFLYFDDSTLLLKKILMKIRDGYEDYSYGELFEAFCVEIPVTAKRDLIRYCHLLDDLFPFIGEKNLSLMLKDASPEEKEEILLGYGGIDICSSLANQGEWDLLKFFVGECLWSRDRMIHFKKECERSGRFDDAFFRFFDELIVKCGEKSGREDADRPVSEALCSSSDVSADHV